MNSGLYDSLNRAVLLGLVTFGLAACGSSDNQESASPSAVSVTQSADDGDYVSAVYSDTTNWLCHPELTGTLNACEQSQRTLFVDKQGNATSEQLPPGAVDTSVDCFYVYPTTSGDPTANSDRIADVQERETTFQQFGAFRTACRQFAPIYRQRSLPALAISGRTDAIYSQEDIDAANALAYSDVLDAFRHYISQLSDSRPFVLVGHSQGSRHLAKLIAEEIEPEAGLHSRMIAAYIPGFTLEKPRNQPTGGTFATTKPCETADSVNCVIGYVSYREGDPMLSNPRFGATGNPDTTAICVNPAKLLSQEAYADVRVPFILPPIFQALLRPRGEGGPYANRADNLQALLMHNFYAVPDYIKASCAVAPDSLASYLKITVDQDQRGVRATDFAGEFFGGENWGLHLADMNLFLGDLIQILEKQKTSYFSR